MRGIITFFAVICIVQSHHLNDDLESRARAEECTKESGVEQQLLDDMTSGKPFKGTRELDCFAACLLKKEGNMIDGEVKTKPTDSDAIKECAKLRGKDDCETAGKVMECYSMHSIMPKV